MRMWIVFPTNSALGSLFLEWVSGCGRRAMRGLGMLGVRDPSSSFRLRESRQRAHLENVWVYI